MAAVAAAAMLLSPCAFAQISLSTAVDLALHNDPRVLTAQADVAKAKASLSESKDVYIPSASVSGGYGQSTGVPLGVPVIFSFASQSLLFSFSQKDYIRAARFGLQAAELALKEASDQVTQDVVITYLDLDHAEKRQVAVGEEYGYANKLVTIVQERVNAGQDAHIDWVKAKRTAAQIRLAKLQADDEVATLTDHLGRLIGLRGSPLVLVSTSVPALPTADRLRVDAPTGYGVQASFATAQSKLEVAFGDSRWRLRPQASFFVNYSYIDTAMSAYTSFYPGFAENKTRYAASVGLQIQIPLFDKARGDRAKGSEADALHARYEAENQRNQFLEGRYKLQHNLAELAAQSEIAEADREIAQDQIDQVMIQLQADSGSLNGTLLTPKDEQNARLQERQKYVDLLNAQFQLAQAQINLLRQTGQFSAWLKQAASTPDVVSGAPVKP